MQTQDELSQILPHYLRQRHQFSDETIRSLHAEWNHQGSMLEFLVEKNLLPRSTARTLEAVCKGYFHSPFATVLGVTALPHHAPAEDFWDSDHVTMEVATTAPQPAIPRVPVVDKKVSLVRPLTGMPLGRFTLQEQLGAGVTGCVFRAFHPTLCIPVAIKVFEPLGPDSETAARQRFLREAQTLARLQHPNIVRILAVEVDEPFPYLVMEYVGERTLATQIQTFCRLPAQRIAQIGIAVADALEFTWQQGLLHRDVKPANILERRDGCIKLGDFGISAERTADGGLSDPEAAQGYVSGTPSFIAPEQALTPNDLDFRADMYGLGASLYNAAVGFPPFSAATAYDTIKAQLHGDPTPIQQLDPSFDWQLAQIIHRMLQRDRDQRFGSWVEVRKALSAVGGSAVTSSAA